jgi:hypothetical protein
MKADYEKRRRPDSFTFAVPNGTTIRDGYIYSGLASVVLLYPNLV